MRLTAGLALFGLCLALLVKADLGADPWTVLTQGLAAVTGLTLGQVVIAVSLVLLASWIPLRQRPGPGTVANALLVGPFLDLCLTWLPAPHHLAGRVAFLGAAVIGVAVATGLYVGAGWGAGPRDGLMTGLAERGVPVVVARAGIELTVLGAGWLLGGRVGVATVVFALGIGPLVGYALRRLRLPPSGPPSAAPPVPPTTPPAGVADPHG
ncbi:YczE/YyaS/YitT family protein [Streptomyces sp. CWNU-52B]|uniref:membrane protein YczE n=1 Tax=unclassified Streptomyces TaxID=2593676 RepID=UPI0039BF795D